MKVSIYGHSDDTIEVDGDLREEFYCFAHHKYLHFGDGTVVKCGYAQEPRFLWKFEPLFVGDGTGFTYEPGTYDDEGEEACQKLIIDGDLEWIECWSSADGPTSGDTESFFDTLAVNDLTVDQVRRIMAIVREP